MMHAKKISSIDTETNNNKTKYIIVKQEGTYSKSYSVYRDFEKDVNSKLKEGWKLCGGVSIGSVNCDHFCICQAMIKEEEL